MDAADILRALEATKKLKEALIYQQETLKCLLKTCGKTASHATIKQCPMCETIFQHVSNEEFENHVINHFEIENLSY